MEVVLTSKMYMPGVPLTADSVQRNIESTTVAKLKCLCPQENLL